MFDYKHFVPILKAKRAEFPAVAQLGSLELITPLFEAIPSQPPETVPRQLERAQWPGNRAYFVDLLFFDNENEPEDQPAGAAVSACLAAATERGHLAVPVTGTSRSPSYQDAVRALTNPQRGLAVRLVPEDFEDQDELASALDALTEFVGLERERVDLIIDLGSVADQRAAVITQIHRANLELIPAIAEWRTLTVAAGAFPLELAPLTRNTWNRVPRADWQAWLALTSGSRRPRRLPAYGDYGIAHPGLPPEGQATILAQLRYSTPNEFMIWKGRNAVRQGFDQFFDICADLITRPEYRGADFSVGDEEIQEKATNGGSPGNAETWRRIGTNHHIETVLDQIANLP